MKELEEKRYLPDWASMIGNGVSAFILTMATYGGLGYVIILVGFVFVIFAKTTYRRRMAWSTIAGAILGVALFWFSVLGPTNLWLWGAGRTDH